MRTTLTQSLGISHPIFQAPLAGGGDTPDLVAAVSNAGGLGFIGAGYLTPEQIASTAEAVRTKTTRPFGINLFAPLPPPDFHKQPERMLERLAPYYAELGVPAPSKAPAPTDRFDEQLTAALESGASCFSFTFGLLAPPAVAAIKANKMFLIGTATTVEEAQQLEKSGVDAIVTQGSEAGGHRGTFAGDFAQGIVGTIALVPQVADAVRVPVIASGGIMDGRGIAAALALGAQAVQMGTAFLTCHEAGVPDVYKEAILNSHEDQTQITRAFSGRPARGIVNRFMTEIEKEEQAKAGLIPPFPIQNSLTRTPRTAASLTRSPRVPFAVVRPGCQAAQRQSAKELVARLVEEMNRTLSALNTRGSAVIQNHLR